MTDPRVHILMAVQNGQAWLADVLDSVAAQTYPNIQVTLCDNASTDATSDIVRRYPNIHAITHDTNLGFWASMERMIRRTDAPYVICLTDVVLDPEFVREAVAALEHDPRVGAVQGKIYEHHRNSTGDWERTDVVDAAGFRLQRSRRVTILGHGQHDTGQFAVVTEVFGVEGAVPVFRKSALEDCRLKGDIMDADYRVGGITYADDLDLAWRMNLYGHKQLFVPTAVGWHDRSTTKGTAVTPVIGQLARLDQRARLPIQKRRLDWSNIRFAIVKNDSILDILRDLPYIAAREIAVLGYTLLFEPAVLAEAGRFVKLLPRMLGKRSEVQARAQRTPTDIRRFIT